MPNASNTSRVRDAIGGDDTTATRAVIAVQGPEARRRLASVAPDAAAVARFAVAPFSWHGRRLRGGRHRVHGRGRRRVRRPHRGRAPDFWQAVLDAGVAAGRSRRARHPPPRGGAAPARPRARPGHHAPASGAGLGGGLGQGPTSGAARALERERAAGPRRRLRGLVAEGRQPPRDGAAVLAGDTRRSARSRAGTSRPSWAGGSPWPSSTPVAETIDRRRRSPSMSGAGTSPPTSSPLPFVAAGRGPAPRQAVHRERVHAAHRRRCGVDARLPRPRRRSTNSSPSCPRRCAWPGGSTSPAGLPEPDVFAHMEDLAAANRPCGRDLVCFAGAGAYDHEVPPVTRALASRSEFVTSYTPYQPEVAQGVLQAVFEFQTLVARLSGLAVSNASLYDGAASLVEAVNLAVGATGPPGRLGLARRQPVVARGPRNLRGGHRPSHPRHPAQRRARRTGRRRTSTTPTSPAPSSSPIPTTWAASRTSPRPAPACDRTGALLIVAFDPDLRRGSCARPATGAPTWWWGRARPSACRLSFGGPYLGLFACTMDHVRRLPGRLVGETVDAEGRAPTSRRCGPGSRTSGARRRPPTSARTRPSWR